jgi:hypothetical protein
VQVAAWLVLVQVKNKHKRSLLARPLGVENTSTLGSRDPVASESSAGRMVARTAGQSRGQFLGGAWKPRSSGDYMGAESWVAISGGYTEFAGFAVVHQKTTRLLGWPTKPRSKTRRGGATTQAESTAQEERSDRLGRSNCLGGSLTALVAVAEKLRS